MKGIFIVGTGTGVGKTIVTAGLVRALRNSGVDAVPAKPVSTGCISTDRELLAPDLEYCLALSGLKPGREERELMCSFMYRPACSPHLAGRLAGSYASIGVITEALSSLLQAHDMVLAEVAGGVLTPMNESRTMLDLLIECGWPVLLVASGSLGTINHTLLSLDSLRTADVPLVGVVVNHCNREPDMAGRHNPAAIEGFGRIGVLAEIPFVEDFEARDRNRMVVSVFDSLAERLTASVPAG